MKRVLGDWLKYSDLIVAFGKQADWALLESKEVNLTAGFIQLLLDRLLSIPPYIKQIRIQLMAQALCVHITPILLPEFSVRLTCEEFKWEKGKHYVVLGFKEGNSRLVTAGLKWLISPQAKTTEYMVFDGIHKEICVDFKAIPKVFSLLETEFEEGKLGDLLGLKIKKIDPEGIIMRYGLNL